VIGSKQILVPIWTSTQHCLFVFGSPETTVNSTKWGYNLISTSWTKQSTEHLKEQCSVLTKPIWIIICRFQSTCTNTDKWRERNMHRMAGEGHRGQAGCRRRSGCSFID